MKILHINCNYIGTTLHQLMVEKLNELGYKNQVFVPTYDKKLSVIDPKEYVMISECFKKWDRIWFDYKQRKIFNSVKKNIDVTKFDIIHAYTLFTDGNCAMRLFEKFNIPYVVAVRNTDINDFLKKMIHLRSRAIEIMQKSSAIFFLSESYRKQVFEKYVPEKLREEFLRKSYIIPNGIDDFWLENNSIANKCLKKKDIRIVYAGRIDKNKNIPTTLKALEILERKGYNPQLTVVGKIAEETEYEKIKNSKYLNYIPAKPKEELIEIYRSNDIFVMPSTFESFGLVYAEAMSQRLPVIYSAGQGFDMQFPEGRVGFRVKSDDPSDIADKIIMIINNYETISNQAIEGAAIFNWSSIAKKYAEFYNSLTGGC